MPPETPNSAEAPCGKVALRRDRLQMTDRAYNHPHADTRLGELTKRTHAPNGKRERGRSEHRGSFPVAAALDAGERRTIAIPECDHHRATTGAIGSATIQWSPPCRDRALVAVEDPAGLLGADCGSRRKIQQRKFGGRIVQHGRRPLA